MNKYQHYAFLADSHAQEVVKNAGSWAGMLDLVARLYKYPFDEQLLIHAQKPDATACATIPLWNKAMNRAVKKGTKGIAVLDNSGGKQRLKHVFDVADTHGGIYAFPRTPRLWQMQPAHETHISEALRKHMKADTAANELNTEFFQSLAKELAANYIEENRDDIIQSIGGENLEKFEETLVNSTAYTIMSRCGVDIAPLVESGVFHSISSFDTPKALKSLGQGISEISENVLREIEAVIKHYEQGRGSHEIEEGREENAERIRNNLSLGRGLSDSRHNDSREGGESTLTNEVRHDAQIVLEGAEGDNLHGHGSVRGTVPPLHGAGGTSRGTHGNNDEAVDNAEPAARQGSQPDGVGATHERTSSPSGGNNLVGIDSRIPIVNEMPEQPSDEGFFNVTVQQTQATATKKFVQPSLANFPTEAEQLAEINARAEAENAKLPVVVTAEDVEAALIAWNGDIESKARIYKQMTSGENARNYMTALYLKEEFGSERDLFSVTKDGAMPFEISWENVQFRINRLIDEGKFLTPQDWAFIKAQEKAPAPEAEKSSGLPITRGIARAFRGHKEMLYAHDKNGLPLYSMCHSLQPCNPTHKMFR